ncbi:MAG: Fe-S cluster assembly protein SufD [Acidobacteria bacterium]|nr:Fe-S cluster assembly protein SufD [Acidobacteriota bacterium]
MIEVDRETEPYLASFAALEEQRRGEPRWVRWLRESAMERFMGLGFPTSRLEDWKFTSVSPITRMSFQLAPHRANGLSVSELEQLSFLNLGRPCLTFIDGHYSPKLSTPGVAEAGVRMGSLADALQEGSSVAQEHLGRHALYTDQAFAALNTAFLHDGAFLEVPKGVVMRAPIHLLFLFTAGGTPLVSHPRSLLLVGRESQVDIVESYVALGEGVYFTNAITELVLGENAIVNHYRLQRESPLSFHVATLQAEQGRASTLISHNISMGGALVRNEINSVLSGEGAECTLHGLYLATGLQHVDNHTVIDHARPHCSSREVYKGILDGQASAVFNGKIIVRKDAQKTDAKQTNKNLLLSDDATVNTKPQLEIYADDVKCTHGATIGQLNEEAVFYLRSRGISREEARKLLTYAFANEIVSRIQVAPIRSGLEELVPRQLGKYES